MDFGLDLADNTAATFEQDNSIDFGVDLGVEKVYKTLLGRLWLGYNFSGLISGDTTTSSLRGGLDFTMISGLYLTLASMLVF